MVSVSQHSQEGEVDNCETQSTWVLSCSDKDVDFTKNLFKTNQPTNKQKKAPNQPTTTTTPEELRENLEKTQEVPNSTNCCSFEILSFVMCLVI